MPVRGHEDGELKGEGVSIFSDLGEVFGVRNDGLDSRYIGRCDPVSADVIFLGDPHEFAFAVSDWETESGAGVEAAQVARLEQTPTDAWNTAIRSTDEVSRFVIGDVGRLIDEYSA